MATSSRGKSNGSAFHHNFQRSLSPSGRFCSSSSAFSTFYTRTGPDSLLSRPTSPTRVNLCRSKPSVRFSTSPRRSIAVSPRHSNNRPVPSNQKKTCMCSPTTHPGSFRCSLHKNLNNHQSSATSYGRSSNPLNMRRSAMTNSLVRIGTVEGDFVKRALATLIRPSSHQVRRRGDFQRRPSRLSVMSKADDL